MTRRDDVNMPALVDGRGRGRERLPGETQLEMCRRTRKYEHLREQFTHWVTVEGRSYVDISIITGYSVSSVSLIARALGIKKTFAFSTLVNTERWALPRTMERWREQEHAFQRMRLTHCGSWDRGW